MSENEHFYKAGPDRSRALLTSGFDHSPAAPGVARKAAWWGKARARVQLQARRRGGVARFAGRLHLGRPHTEVTFSDTHASPSR